MKKVMLICLLSIVLIITSVMPAAAERGDDSKRASKNGKAEGVIDGVNVTLEYGRPKVKGRTIWGDLVPFDKIWRTGANEATTISFSKDVKVQGKALAAGTYSLFTIPGKDQWMFVFNKTAKQWGSMKYDEKQDALRVKTTPITDGHEEEMTFKIKDNEIALCWEQLVVPFKVAAK